MIGKSKLENTKEDGNLRGFLFFSMQDKKGSEISKAYNIIARTRKNIPQDVLFLFLIWKRRSLCHLLSSLGTHWNE